MGAAGVVMFFISLLGLLAIVTLFLATYSGHSLLEVLQQTAAGSDEVEWPDEPFTDWLGKGVYFWGLVAFWPALLWLMFRNSTAVGTTGHIVLYGLALWLLFPISLLSSLSAASPFVVLRWQVLAQLLHRWEAYPLFAVVSPVLPVSVVLANYWIVLGRGPTVALVFALPLVAFGTVYLLLVYARLIGKLCWIIRPPVVRKSAKRPERLPLAGAQSAAPSPTEAAPPRPRPAQRKSDDETYGFQEDEPPPPMVAEVVSSSAPQEEEAEDEDGEDAGPEPEPPSKSAAGLLHPNVYFFPLYEQCRTPLVWLTLEWGLMLVLIVSAQALYRNSIAPRLETPEGEARSHQTLIDHIARRLAEQHAATVLAALDAHVEQPFLGIERGVRIQDDAVMGRMARITPGDDERMVVGRRLFFQYVEGGAGDPAGGHGLEDGERVHDAATRGVDQERTGRHLGQRLAIDEMTRLRRQRAVQADHV
jgi:hypothetical protein